MSLTAWERVGLARSFERPTGKYYIDNCFHDFFELHGDRGFADDPSIIGGIAKIGDERVTVIAQEKGRDTNERVYRNFGSPHPEGYRKALRLMYQAQKFKRPIICLVDTQGAFCGIGAEERGQGEAIARNLMEMMKLSVPVISVVIGEGGSGGALGLAVANRVAMLENSVYSILSPEGFASILWKDSSRAEEAAESMRLTAQDLLELGVIEDVLREPEGGAQQDAERMAQDLSAYLVRTLRELCDKTPDELRQERYARFRKIGNS